MQLFLVIAVCVVLSALPGGGAAAQAASPSSIAAPVTPSHRSAPILGRVDDVASARGAVVRGALLGAVAGTVSGLLVLSACDRSCDGVRLEGMVLHVGLGAGMGAGVGALVHRFMRR